MFPAYVAVVAGILFLAFVYFAVGQAAVLRNGAQTAADAAALGAAQDARDRIREGWLEVIGDPTQWQRFVHGWEEEYVTEQSCQRAIEFASLNEAEVDDCLLVGSGFRVTARTEDTVGSSIVPNAENRQAVATATAVIESRCSFDFPEPPEEPDSAETPSPTPSPEPEEPEPTLELVCDGGTFSIDPEAPLLPGADDLFRVRLTGDDE